MASVTCRPSIAFTTICCLLALKWRPHVGPYIYSSTTNFLLSVHTSLLTPCCCLLLPVIAQEKEEERRRLQLAREQELLEERRRKEEMAKREAARLQKELEEQEMAEARALLEQTRKKKGVMFKDGDKFDKQALMQASSTWDRAVCKVQGAYGSLTYARFAVIQKAEGSAHTMSRGCRS